jgi:hypothetical protein
LTEAALPLEQTSASSNETFEARPDIENVSVNATGVDTRWARVQECLLSWSVAHQLGHAIPRITLSIYAHLFDAAAHGACVAAVLEAAALGGKAAENGGGERRRTDDLATAANVAVHPASATAGD